MKDVCSLLVVVCMTTFAFFYLRDLLRGLIAPSLSMWTIFTVGTLLSMLTYLDASDMNIKGGTLNIVDFFYTATIAFLIGLWSTNGRFHFRSFEKKYLVATGLATAFWFVTGDSFVTNILIQVIIALGYPPAYEKLWRAGRNTESYPAWICIWCANVAALIPACMDQNTLSIIYAARSLTLVSTMLILMLALDARLRSKSRLPSSHDSL